MFVMYVDRSLLSRAHTGFIESGMKHLIPINAATVDVFSSKS